MHIASVNVRFYETDMMGIAHHSNHFRWFEMARIEFLRKIGVTLWDMIGNCCTLLMRHLLNSC